MRKIVVILRTIFIIIILLFTTLVFVPNAMGIESSIELLGTMEPTIPKGSITYLNKKVSYESLKENDIISIKKYNQKNIVRVISKDDSEKTYNVKGDAESKQEITVITKKDYCGKKIFSIPKIGVIVLFMQRNFLITFILIIFILISLIADFIKYKNIDITKTLKIINPNKQNKDITTDEVIDTITEDEKIENIANSINNEDDSKVKNKVIMKNQDLTAEILDEKEVKEIIEILDSNDNEEKTNESKNYEKAEILYTIDSEKKKDDDIEIL